VTVRAPPSRRAAASFCFQVIVPHTCQIGLKSAKVLPF
jgi:hypothetical protein